MPSQRAKGDFKALGKRWKTARSIALPMAVKRQHPFSPSSSSSPPQSAGQKIESVWPHVTAQNMNSWGASCEHTHQTELRISIKARQARSWIEKARRGWRFVKHNSASQRTNEGEKLHFPTNGAFRSSLKYERISQKERERERQRVRDIYREKAKILRQKLLITSKAGRSREFWLKT